MADAQLGGFFLGDILGEGGMGTVYRAHDPTLDRTVALKIIRSSALSAEGRARFLHEARACSRINHPNIITVYAAGEDDGTPYMAMEFVEGQTLREKMAAGPIDWRTALRWTIALLTALDRLHRAGIVHRDLKPENIMITHDGVIKLMDFGLAHLTNTTALTQDGSTLGTVPYMSPEQVLGRPADARSDLFAIGTILHEMLTGVYPFRGEHPMAVMYSIQHDTPRSIRVQSHEYPPGLQDVLDTALAKEVDRRYANAEAFLAALRPMLPEGGAMRTPAKPARGRAAVGLFAALGATIILALGFLGWQKLHKKQMRARAIALNAQGSQSIADGDLEAASKFLREAILADGRMASPYQNLAMVSLARKDTATAEENFRAAIRRDPRFAPPRFMMGILAERRGKTDEAEHWYKISIEADSTYLAGFSNLVSLYLDRSRKNEARRLLARALRIGPVPTQLPAAILLSRKQARLYASDGNDGAAARWAARAESLDALQR